jgi:hypothetical protein
LGVVAVDGEPGDLGRQTDNSERLVAAICELAERDPRQARQAIETAAAHLDAATHGKHTEELELLEAAALEALRLDAKHMLAALDDVSLEPGEPAPGQGPTAPPES